MLRISLVFLAVLVFLSTAVAQESFRLTIMHTNDRESLNSNRHGITDVGGITSVQLLPILGMDK